MGGNALKNCTTRRCGADEYYALEHEIVSWLNYWFPKCDVHVIKAYRNKDSFGDIDILITSDELPNNWVETIKIAFCPLEAVKNGNVLSFEHKQFQVDLITTPRSEFVTSQHYFGYNDLGNLMGRIAHSMGLKLGHDGLSYNWRVDSYQFKNEIISTDWEVICNVLGLSYERYCEGFDELEDIFKFVVASPLFNKDIYLLENRNNYARTRDKKRPTYNAFLKWIEDHHSETKEQVANSMWDDMYRASSGGKDHWLDYLFMQIPGFEETYNRVQKEWQDEVEYKSKFNGSLVREWTGLEDQELGQFMKWLKESLPTHWKQAVLDDEIEDVERTILYKFGVYKRQREIDGL